MGYTHLLHTIASVHRVSNSVVRWRKKKNRMWNVCSIAHSSEEWIYIGIARRKKDGFCQERNLLDKTTYFFDNSNCDYIWKREQKYRRTDPIEGIDILIWGKMERILRNRCYFMEEAKSQPKLELILTKYISLDHSISNEIDFDLIFSHNRIVVLYSWQFSDMVSVFETYLCVTFIIQFTQKYTQIQKRNISLKWSKWWIFS